MLMLVLKVTKATEGRKLINPHVNLKYTLKAKESLNLIVKSVCPSYSYNNRVKKSNEDATSVQKEQPVMEVYNASLTKREYYVYNSSNLNTIENREEEGKTFRSTLYLPVYASDDEEVPNTEEPYIITNLIHNPYGYYHEFPITPVIETDNDGKYIAKETDIPLYANGEIYLVDKGKDYSIENSKTILVSVKYLSSQSA